jgi:D-alanine-D-alanine ligase
MDKRTIAVLFGGSSSEHEVSCVSATTVIQHINKEHYDIVLIGITREGKWLLVPNAEAILDGSWRNGGTIAVISPDKEQKAVIIMEGSKFTSRSLDVIFPVLHGLNGEDGTVQGLFELSGIPYVGCGVLASAVAMDKLYTKIIVDTLGIRQAAYVGVMSKDLQQMPSVVDKVEAKLAYPVFIKPSNAGSSQGVSKAHNREELMEGLYKAAQHDRKILVEETILGREIECAVLGGNEAKASGIGEIVAAAEFYDYDAKYNNVESKTILSPELPDGVEAKVRDYATRIFRAVDGYGLSRVDFFLTKEKDEVVFNEINTLPGFTSISMYPMLWEAKGIAKQQLVEKLIQSAFIRNAK